MTTQKYESNDQKVDLSYVEEKNTSKVDVSSHQFKHYQFRKELGEGGFGMVYEAWDSKLMRAVAIKQVKNLGSVQTTQNLLQEARMAASLNHPAFVKIHSIEDDVEQPAIVMELVPGLTLKAWMVQQRDEGKVNQALVLDVIGQIAEAMQEAHASGLVHGDLKPSNFIVEPSGKVRILDFGLAVKADLQVTTSMSQADPQGTIAYMAPERLTGHAPTVQGDIYALGVILFEMMNGARPFVSLSGLALAAALVQSSSDQWEYAANIETPIIQLIRSMTAKQLDKRLSGMQQVWMQIKVLEQPTSLQSIHPITNKINDSTSTVFGQIWSPRKKRWALILSLSSLLAVGSWQAAPYIAHFEWSDLKPYSESVTMKQGLEALKNFDRPGNLDIANQHFETILKHDTDNAAAVAGLSMVYMYRFAGDKQDETWLAKANAAAQRAMSLNDQVALCYVAKASVLGSQGKREEALPIYDKALSLDPMSFFAYVGKGSILKNLNRLDEAMQVAQFANAKFPKERMFLDEIGSVYFQKGDYANAETAFRQSLVVQPDAIYAYANLSATLTRLDKKDEALQVLQQGLQIRPSGPLYTALGVALFQRGDYIGAASAFENAVSPTKGNPARYNYWGNLADTLLWIPGRKDEAKAAYQKALVLLEPLVARAPKDAALASRMGLYLARVENKRSPEFIIKSLDLAPKNPEVHFRAALAYELLSERRQALEMIAKAVKLGYPVKNIEAEPDLADLRRDPAFLK
jgi:serine/threonine-protein kinase